MLRIGCLLIFVLIVGVPAVASRYLSAGGTLAVIVCEGVFLLFFLPRLGGFAVKQFVKRLFMTKSRVLRGATADVHDVRPTHRPVTRAGRRDHSPEEEPSAAAESLALPDAASTNDPDAPAVVTGDVIDPRSHKDADNDEDGEDDVEDPEANRRYVLVDFTLTPRPGASRMQFYDPSEILLVPHDARVDFDADPTEGGADVAQLHQLDDAGAPHEVDDKLTGPARLRAVFACPPDLRGRVKFRYYFEAFGDLTLPDPD